MINKIFQGIRIFGLLAMLYFALDNIILLIVDYNKMSSLILIVTLIVIVLQILMSYMLFKRIVGVHRNKNGLDKITLCKSCGSSDVKNGQGYIKCNICFSVYDKVKSEQITLEKVKGKYESMKDN